MLLTAETPGALHGFEALSKPVGHDFVEQMSATQRAEAFVVDLDRPFGACGCVIMASGLGRRFGGNKLMASFLGMPMIAHILNATEGLFERRVVVTRHETVEAYCRSRGIETVLHALPMRSDVVRLGLERMADTERCLFCPADQPLLSRETVMGLLLCAGDQPERILRPVYQGNPGAPILFPRWAYPELMKLSGKSGGGIVVRMHADRVSALEVDDARELEDVDTQEDLTRLLQSVKEAPI